MAINLTFGIPTYNGSKTILDTLKSICTQQVNDSFSFDILISNNNSTDDVIDVCHKYFQSINFTDYLIINNEFYDNTVDGNILNLYRNFSGEYLWFISDDDTLSTDESLLLIINIIKCHSPNIITCNYNECDFDLKILKKRFRKKEIIDTYSDNKSEWLLNSQFYFGLISSLIVKRNLVDINQIFKFYGLLSLHIPIALLSAANGQTVCINNRLINLRTGNTTWGKNGSFLINFLHISLILHKMKDYNYDSNAITKTIKINFKDNWKNIIKAKNEGLHFTSELMFEEFIVYKKFIRFWFLDIYLLFLPNKIISFFKIFYKTKYKNFINT